MDTWSVRAHRPHRLLLSISTQRSVLTLMRVAPHGRRPANVLVKMHFTCQRSVRLRATFVRRAVQTSLLPAISGRVMDNARRMLASCWSNALYLAECAMLSVAIKWRVAPPGQKMDGARVIMRPSCFACAHRPVVSALEHASTNIRIAAPGLTKDSALKIRLLCSRPAPEAAVFASHPARTRTPHFVTCGVRPSAFRTHSLC